MKNSAKQIAAFLWLFLIPLYWGSSQTGTASQPNLKTLQRQAEAGNVADQARLGEMYMDGDGVPKDATIGFRWSYRAALAGSPLGAREVSSAYWEGLGVLPSKATAFEWAWIAANRADLVAQGAMILYYLKGTGVRKDPTLAYAWALIRNGERDKRTSDADASSVGSLEAGLLEDQKSEAIALAAAWKRNKEHVMPIHSRWYLDHPSGDQNALAKPRELPSASGGCSSGHWISDNIDSGKYIKLEDGSLWEVNGADTVDSALWLETDDITVCSEKLINTDDKDSVEAKRIN